MTSRTTRYAAPAELARDAGIVGDDSRPLAVVPVTIEIRDAGIALAERYTLSVYDAMIAAAALDAGCDRLWSEDMQHGLLIDNALRIANPFRLETEPQSRRSR